MTSIGPAFAEYGGGYPQQQQGYYPQQQPVYVQQAPPQKQSGGERPAVLAACLQSASLA